MPSFFGATIPRLIFGKIPVENIQQLDDFTANLMAQLYDLTGDWRDLKRIQVFIRSRPSRGLETLTGLMNCMSTESDKSSKRVAIALFATGPTLSRLGN